MVEDTEREGESDASVGRVLRASISEWFQFVKGVADTHHNGADVTLDWGGREQQVWGQTISNEH